MKERKDRNQGSLPFSLGDKDIITRGGIYQNLMSDQIAQTAIREVFPEIADSIIERSTLEYFHKNQIKYYDKVGDILGYINIENVEAPRFETKRLWVLKVNNNNQEFYVLHDEIGLKKFVPGKKLG